MKTTQMYAWVSGLVMTALLTAPAGAILIDFDSGYSEGDLAGQPSSGTQWAELNDPHRNGFNVTADAGDLGAGDQAIVSTKGPDPAALAGYYRFTPSDADLGMTFDGSSSVVDFSFKRKLLADVGLNGTVVAYCWFSDAARLTWYSDGRMKYNVGGTDMASYVLNSTGGTLDPNVADGYITVSGSLDYATKTYTLTVDGVAQNGGNPIAFYDSNATTINASIINANPHNSLYRRYAYDDISLTPEPATLGLLSVGGLALLRRRKK